MEREGICSVNVIRRQDVEPFRADDGAFVRELASPANTALTRHSVAEIRHPAGTASHDHYHVEAEEVYIVLEGCGEIRIDGTTTPLCPGDIVAIPPGQAHKVWQRGEGDLVLLVTCSPAWSADGAVCVE
jgi:mannose-6-phosphate isomerase-like protein (cupin superfamily)